MMKLSQIDLPLIIIGFLLAATLAAFFTGLFPYPFGFIILGFVLFARIIDLWLR